MQPIDSIVLMMTKPPRRVIVLFLIALCFLFLDKPIALMVYHLNFYGYRWMLSAVSQLGLGIVYIVFFALSGLYFRTVSVNVVLERKMWFLWLCITFPYFVCFLFKMILGRARPELLFSQDIYGFFGPHLSVDYWSFPSGHTTSIMALVLGLGILFPRRFYALFFLGIGIALLRVILLKHYLSDVLIAIYITAILVRIVHHQIWPLFQRNLLQNQNE